MNCASSRLAGGAAPFPAPGSFFSSLGAALEQWAKVVNVYICTWKGCSLPATEKEQLYENLSQVFCSMARNWLDCEEEEVRSAAFPAGDGSRDAEACASVCAQRAGCKRPQTGSVPGAGGSLRGSS